MLLFSSESCGELLCNGIKSQLYQVMVLFQVTVDDCNTLYRKPGWASVRGKMLLCTSHQRRGYVGLCEPTGEPVEGRLVGILPTKTSGWGKGGEHLTRGTAPQGAITGNNRVACVIGSCFNSSLVGLRFVQDVYIG